MSIVAEFARQLHESFPCEKGMELTPLDYPSKGGSLADIRVALFDVYGTLVNYWKRVFATEAGRQHAVLAAFDKVIDRFGIKKYLVEMNPDEPPEKTLSDLYHGLISLKHGLAAEKNIEFPEVRIEDIWEAILLMLERHGYDPSGLALGKGSDFLRCMAYCYNFFAFNRGLYPGVADALQRLKEENILLGILSNAQFYTPIDLSLFLRDQSNGDIDDYSRLFEHDFVFFSFEYGVSKPNSLLFRKLFDALYQHQILPSQALLVGNDLVSDIKPAQEAGMKTAFFTGDNRCVFTHGSDWTIIPDISFTSWNDVSRRVTFYSKAENGATKGLA
ncbi:MAG TPA: HAD family hydrolase [Chitinivibrionales bacterium]|nr:HAD family hydrolase [Chitinivibrionales bacterium]